MKITMFLILLVLVIPFVHATEAGVTPDSFWYGFDVLWDKVSLALTYNNEKKAQKAMEIALERLEEAKQMAENQNPDASLKAQDEYLNTIKYVDKISNKTTSKEKETIEIYLEVHYNDIDKILNNETDSPYIKNGLSEVRTFLNTVRPRKENKTKENEIVLELDEEVNEEPEPQKPVGDNFKLYLQVDNDWSSINQVFVKFSKAVIFLHNGESELISKELVELTKDDPILILSTRLEKGNYSKIELFLDSVEASSMDIQIPGDKIMIQENIEILPEDITKFVHYMKFVSLGEGNFYDFVAIADKTFSKKELDKLPECYENSHCGDNWECTLDRVCVFQEPEIG